LDFDAARENWFWVVFIFPELLLMRAGLLSFSTKQGSSFYAAPFLLGVFQGVAVAPTVEMDSRTSKLASY